jgi:hypothetical protein
MVPVVGMKISHPEQVACDVPVLGSAAHAVRKLNRR